MLSNIRHTPIKNELKRKINANRPSIIKKIYNESEVNIKKEDCKPMKKKNIKIIKLNKYEN